MVEVTALLVCYLRQSISSTSIDQKPFDYGTQSQLELITLCEAREELSITLLAAQVLSPEKLLAWSRLGTLT